MLANIQNILPYAGSIVIGDANAQEDPDHEEALGCLILRFHRT